MKRLSLLLALTLFVLPVWAQTIDRSDLEAQVGVEFDVFVDRSANASSALDAIIEGGAANFSSIVGGMPLSYTRLLMTMPADVPGADSFATATHVEAFAFGALGGADSTVYLFSTITDDDVKVHGSSIIFTDTNQDGNADLFVTRFTPSWLQTMLPAGPGTSWNSSYGQVTWVPLPGGVFFRTDGVSIDFEYDITGTTTLTTPAGSGDAIRVHFFQIITQPPPVNTVECLETFSFIAESGLAVEVSYNCNPNNRDRLGLNHIAHFVPKGGGGPTAIETITAEIPDNFELGQNYPNPFNPTTIIPFGLSEAGHVTLTVYNVLGQEVARLMDERLPAGQYTTDFRTASLPSGLYLYTLQGDGIVRHRTMTLQK